MKICIKTKSLFIVSDQNKLFILDCETLKVNKEIPYFYSLFLSHSISIDFQGKTIMGIPSMTSYFMKFLNLNNNKMKFFKTPDPNNSCMVQHCLKWNRVFYSYSVSYLALHNSNNVKKICQKSVGKSYLTVVLKLREAYKIIAFVHDQELMVLYIKNSIQILQKIPNSQSTYCLNTNFDCSLCAFGGNKNLRLLSIKKNTKEEKKINK